jgi:hypothetical protein
LSSPVASSEPVTTGEPVELLDRAIEIIHLINRAFPRAALSREELIALSGLLTQISGALLTLTDLLIAPAQRYGRTRALPKTPDSVPSPPGQSAAGLLLDCRNSYLDASTSARACHAALKR